MNREHIELRMIELPDPDRVSQVACNSPGFNCDWWDSTSDSDYDGSVFSFALDGETVALAAVTRGSLEKDRDGIIPAADALQVDFFEVRGDRRREGIGTAAIHLLVDRFRNDVLVAFSLDSDSFWTGIGWTLRPRFDGDTSFSPMFVFDGRAAFQRRSPLP